MNIKKLRANKTFSMKINLTMRSFLKYSICSVCSIFLLSFIHCTDFDEFFLSLSSLDKLPIGEDATGFIFTPVSREVNVIEGMQVDYTVQLSSEPTGDVTLNVKPTTGLSGSVASLTFTPLNWNAAQRVTITADDNNYIGITTQLQVNHDVSSADSKYNSIAPGQVSVNVIDDDGMGHLVISTNMLAFDDVDGATGRIYTISLSHDPASGKTVRVSLSENSADLEVSPMVIDFDGTPEKSSQRITVRRAGGALGMIMSDVIAAISHTIATGVSYDPNIATFSNAVGTVNVTINSTFVVPSVTIPTSSLTVAEGGLAETYMISLATEALPPSGENVVINLSSNHALLTVNPSRLTLNSSNPSKIVRVTRVNNNIDENDGLMGMISHSLEPSTGASYNINSVQNTVRQANITVTMNDDDTAGFIFTPANREVSVAEGMQVGYTVKLSSEPTGDVTLNVNPATGLSGSVASLRFASSNWNATQGVTITADDNNYVGGYTAQVNHGVSSTDSKYSSIAPGQVTVNVADDDGGTGTIVISPSALDFDDTDGATGATYTLSLSHDPAPGKTVRVSLGNGNGILKVSPMVVDFDDITGRSPQTITVKRAGDASGMIMADIFVAISHTIAMGVSYDPNITTFANSGNTVNVTINSTVLIDSDHDGLIEIKDETMFNNMRHDLAGASYKTSASQTTGDSSGCPLVSGSRVCHGYELTANIDLKSLLDKNGNKMIDTMTVEVAGEEHTVIDIDDDEDTSWVPIGSLKTPFIANFEGNNHTIANLWVNVSSSASNVNVYGGLFGVTGGTTTIRNVDISGSIYSSITGSSTIGYSGGLVGRSKSSLTITNCTFSGDNGVSSTATDTSYSGGLVGYSDESLTITNCAFLGNNISSSASASSSFAISGGLVGNSENLLTITNCAFFGGNISSSASDLATARPTNVISGGLVGTFKLSLTIEYSVFLGSGEISSSSSNSSSLFYSGGLLGYSNALNSLTITNSYWNIDAIQKVGGSSQNQKRAQGNATFDAQGYLVDAPGATALTLTQLKAIPPTAAISYPSGLPHSATDNTKAWDLGTDMQLPAIKRCLNTACTLYGALLAGQRP